MSGFSFRIKRASKCRRFK